MPFPIIWVISDDPTIRQYLQAVLEHARYQVRTFMLPGDALDCMQYPALVPHLVCLHLSSSEDGYKVSEQLKACSISMCIILFSPSPAHPIERIKAQRAGVERLLAIPTPSTIRAVLVEIAALLHTS